MKFNNHNGRSGFLESIPGPVPKNSGNAKKSDLVKLDLRRDRKETDVQLGQFFRPFKNETHLVDKQRVTVAIFDHCGTAIQTGLPPFKSGTTLTSNPTNTKLVNVPV